MYRIRSKKVLGPELKLMVVEAQKSLPKRNPVNS